MPRYYTVKLCIALQNPGFTGFLAEELKKKHFDVIFPSGIINLLFHGLTYNTRGHFAHYSHFSSSFRPARKNTKQLAEYLRVLYVKMYVLVTTQVGDLFNAFHHCL